MIDPLLSTGFPLTLLGVTRLARLLQARWQSPSFQSGLKDYARQTALELQTTANLVGALYATMDRFDLFKQLSLLYFAAASYSETARRLGRPELADSFLLSRHPVFAPALQEICSAVQASLLPADAAALGRRIHELIAPFDVAGLTDAARDPWYPALAADLLRAAPKMGAGRDEITAMLAKCGLGPG